MDAAGLQGAMTNALERHLEGRDYDDSLVGGWSKSIRADVVDEIRSFHPGPAKIVVNLTILQQAGAGMHTASTTLWDPEKDTSVTATWESDKVYASCTAFILRI